MVGKRSLARGICTGLTRIAFRRITDMNKIGFVAKLLKDLVLFAKKEKVYWIVPLVLILLLLALLIVVSQSAAPFIYTLF